MNSNKFFFLAGLQRSGATLLSSILNQNPSIYVSPSSPLLPMLVEADNFYGLLQNKDFDRSKDILNVCKNIYKSLYQDYNQQYIIDKNHWWVIPEGIDLANRYITNDIKIICPVRDVIEVLASFNTIIEKSKRSKNNLIDQQVLRETFDGKPIADRRADWLMKPKNDIDTHLYGMSFAKNKTFRHMFHFVEYNDLVNDTENTINKIYDFLEIERFSHKFIDLDNPMPPDSITGIYNLHKVEATVKKRSVDPSDIFLPDTIARYSNMEFWRNI